MRKSLILLSDWLVADVEGLALEDEAEEDGDKAAWLSVASTVSLVHKYFDRWVTVALDVVLMNLLRVSVNSLRGCGFRMTSISSIGSVCIDDDCSVLVLDSASESTSEFGFAREFLLWSLLGGWLPLEPCCSMSMLSSSIFGKDCFKKAPR
jgi:hypothetical protein